MTKKEIYINTLKPLLTDRTTLENFLIANSNLPGPRSNLELAFALAEIYDTMNVLLEWLKISATEVGVNQPRSFLAFCAAVCLGKIYTKNKEIRIINLLKEAANDERWRMREAVAFAFQYIGTADFNELKKLFSQWIKQSNNYGKRAILVALAHPPFLNEERALYCFEIAEFILTTMDREKNFDVLRKGLEFTLSVFAAANPAAGLDFLERWQGKDTIINRIIRENLKKKRLMKADSQRVEKLLSRF